MADKKPEPSRKCANTAGAKWTTAKPTLLVGGNPQIAKADGDAPVQAYIAAMPGANLSCRRTWHLNNNDAACKLGQTQKKRSWGGFVVWARRSAC